MTFTFTRPVRTAAVFIGIAVSGALIVSLTNGAESADASRRHFDIGKGIAAARSAHTAAPKSATKTTSKASTAPTSTPSTPSSVSTQPTSALPKPDSTTATQPFLGTLVTDSDNAPQESQAGLKMAMLEIQWRYLEPSRGVYNAKYATSMAGMLAKFQRAGMRVTLGLGLHFAPKWALDMAGSRAVNQNGATSSQVDLVFNQQMRDLAGEYLAMVDRAVGFDNFWAVRVTAGGQPELFYPAGGFWAYSDGAQNGLQRPTSMPANPMPGWRPTDDATPAQREAYLRWYVGALSDVADWQMASIAAFDFHGYYQLITPGQGIRPNQFAGLATKKLTNTVVGRGAVWYLVYGGLKQRHHVIVHVSSVADGSANNDGCDAGDASVAITDPSVYLWSATRWLTRVARENGFGVSGEVPGYSGGAAGAFYRNLTQSGLLAVSMAQARSCNFMGLYWAHDAQVWNGTMPLSQLARYTTTDAAMPALAKR